MDEKIPGGLQAVGRGGPVDMDEEAGGGVAVAEVVEEGWAVRGGSWRMTCSNSMSQAGSGDLGWDLV